MKRYLLLAISVFIFTSACSTSASDMLQSQLTGKWEWVRSTGGFAGQVITPDSAGATLYFITFSPLHKFAYQRADTLFRSGIYTLHEQDGEMVIHFKTETVDDNFFPDQWIQFQSKDTLILIDECADCYINMYKRIH